MKGRVQTFRFHKTTRAKLDTLVEKYGLTDRNQAAKIAVEVLLDCVEADEIELFDYVQRVNKQDRKERQADESDKDRVRGAAKG